MPSTEPGSETPARADPHVVVLARYGRDALVICQTLARASIATEVATDMADVGSSLAADAGVLLLTVESLTVPGVTELEVLLSMQPEWSDLPVLLLVSEQGPPEAPSPLSGLASTLNLTVLQRPTPAITLITAVQSALRARTRQLQVRDLLHRERLAREQAEAATRLKDAFLATVSHELRTPLSAILIWTRLLESRQLVDDQDGRRAAAAIKQSAEAQKRLVEDLLDVSRLVSGKLALAVTAQPVAPILMAAANIVRPQADAKHVQLTVELAECCEALVDADRLQQVVWNLLSNAVKFTAEGGSVSLRSVREGDWLRVQVQDTGEGIDPAFLPNVFERFRQADSSSTRRHGGLGLGLAIVRQLMELHGGSVDATSAGKGHGATFTANFPVPINAPNRSAPSSGATG